MTPIRFRTSLRSGSFCLKSLDDFFMPGFEFEDNAYYYDCAKRRELVAFFCDKAGWKPPIKKALLDLLDAYENESVSNVELRAGMEKLAEVFAKTGSGCFLGSDGTERYLLGAETASDCVPEANKTAAWLHVLLYSLICRTRFEDFSQEIQNLLLSRFKPTQKPDEDKRQEHQWREITVDEDGKTFELNWIEVPDKPVTPCRLINPNRNRITHFVLNTPIGRRTITIPAGGSMNALFVGDTMTCLKGNIQHRINTAMIKNAENGLDRLDLRRKKLTKEEYRNDAPSDFAIGAYNELYSLQGNVLSMPQQESLDNVMAVFAARDNWIAVMWDGSTRSDRLESCVENVLAIIQEENGLTVVPRSISKDQQKKLVQKMLERFDTGNSGCTEQLCLPNGKLRLMANNKLQWEENG